MSALLPYDLVFAICILLLLLIGVFSATHIQLFSGKRYRRLEVQEKQLLRLPGVWLSASMWLLYFNNTMLALSVVCSVAVVLMASSELPGDDLHIALYTLIALACSLLVNFTHGVEKSQGYRMAFMRMSPLCESFIYRYGRESSGKSFEQRERDVKALIDCRASCEQLIFECHDTKNRHHEKTDPD